MVWRNVVTSAALLSILGGCVSQVQLANDKGQTAQCNAAGLGVVTAAIAASGQKDCIERYQSQGYHQVPLPASSATATTSSSAATNSKGQADQCNTYGWGIVSSLVAASMQQSCVGGSASAAASTGQATQK